LVSTTIAVTRADESIPSSRTWHNSPKKNRRSHSQWERRAAA
jgi:hypothetical protein